MEKELIQLGFNQSEAKIYIALLKYHSLLAGEISKKTGINRRTIYDSLERLEKKGIVGHNIISNKKNYFAINPKILVDKLNENIKLALEILPKLNEVSNNSEEETQIILYKGRKGIKNILNLILSSKEYVSFGTTEQFPEVMEHDYELFQNMKKNLKIKNRTILNKNLKGRDILKSAPNTHFKFLSKNLVGPTSTFIFNNQVAIFVWEKPYFGILIQSKKVYDSYLEYFEELWKFSQE